MTQTTKPTLFAVVSRLSRKTPAGRPMPNGYHWDFYIDKGTVWTDPVFAKMLENHGINAKVSM